MIKFKKLRFRNFLSVGDQFINIQLDKDITTLITGSNGSGKSTLIDALVYVLYGKPFRKVRLGQLLNKVNEKGLEVEIVFSIGKKEYKVIRGQKPAKFQIYIDNNLIEQPATTADYQIILENDILKLNYKTFGQIIILGSASYVPFMKLSLPDRRQIIESILDISVFTKMNIILKSKIKELKNTITEEKHNLELAKEKYNSKREYLKEATGIYNKRLDDFAQKIVDLNQQLSKYKSDKAKQQKLLDGIVKDITNSKYNEDVLNSFNKDISKNEIKIAGDESNYNSIKDNQKVVDELKQRIKDHNQTIEHSTPKLEKLKKDFESNESFIDLYDIEELVSERDELQKDMAVLSSDMSTQRGKKGFYEENDKCPECKQSIDLNFKGDALLRINRIIAGNEKEIKIHQERILVIEEKRKKYSVLIEKRLSLKEKITELKRFIRQYKIFISTVENDISKKTVYTEDELNDFKQDIIDIKNTVKKLKIERDVVNRDHKKYIKLTEQERDITKKLAIINNQIKNNKKIIEETTKDHLELICSEMCLITEEDIEILGESIKELDKLVIKKSGTLHFYIIAQKLLKDDGLKTNIIAKFLPVINALMNKYLDMFDFPVLFEFDENFNETIQSKFRNDFSYYSFSEGEKARIDLALLFTWRELSLNKSRNTANIIIFDEIFQSALDSDGIENFMTLLGLGENYNSFIISHDTDMKMSEFDRHLQFKKDGHFSKVIEN